MTKEFIIGLDIPWDKPGVADNEMVGMEIDHPIHGKGKVISNKDLTVIVRFPFQWGSLVGWCLLVSVVIFWLAILYEVVFK